jgi:glutaconate CoA-transferase subunit A
MTDIVALETLAGRVAPGQLIAIPVHNSGVAMALTAALIESGIRDIGLICVPISGLQADLLARAR